MTLPPEATENVRDEYAFTVGDLLQTMWKRLWIIVLVPILTVALAIGFSLLQTPVYEASIKVLVGQEQSEEPSNLQSNVQGLQQLTQTMELAVDSRPVAMDVIQRLDLETEPEAFLGELSAEQLGATQFIEVSYRDTDPELAQTVANTTGEVFSEEISEVNPSTEALTATVWERASVPEFPVSPSFLRNIFLGLVVGVLIGVALALLTEYLDDSWRSPEEVESISGVPTFGVIPGFEGSKRSAQREKREKKGKD